MPSDFLKTTLWAITPAYLDKIDTILTAHFSGEKLDLAAIEAAMGRELKNDKKPYEVVDGAAVIPVVGAVGKRMNMFMRISGGVSTELLQSDIAEALDDPAVEAIVLNIDSPGGTVDGTMELADWLRSQRGQKPIYAYADGLIASAAYWIGSSADKVFGYSTANVGSIGVVVTHYDRSKQDDKYGITRTMITAGKYKRVAADNAPLSEDGRAYLQDMVDGVYSLFVDGVAASRGVDVSTVLADMADGRVFLAGEALKRGMLDGIATLDETINAARAAAQSQQEDKYMDARQVREKYPEAAAALVAEGKQQAEATANDEAVKAAVSGETERLLGVYSMLHGDEDREKFKTLAATGITAEQAVAFKAAGIGIPAAPAAGEDDSEAEMKKKILAGLERGAEGNDPGHQVRPGTKAGSGDGDFEAKVKEHMEATGDKRVAALKAVAKQHPDLHEAWLTKASK